MESGALLPCGDCVPGRGAAAWPAGEPAVPSGPADWSLWIVTVRIFFGPVVVGVPSVAVELEGAIVEGET